MGSSGFLGFFSLVYGALQRLLQIALNGIPWERPRTALDWPLSACVRLLV